MKVLFGCFQFSLGGGRYACSFGHEFFFNVLGSLAFYFILDSPLFFSNVVSTYQGFYALSSVLFLKRVARGFLVLLFIHSCGFIIFTMG